MAAQFARALYTFEGSRIDNLPFKEGDIITVLKQDDGGWWQGSSLDGRIGCAFARARGSRETNEARPWHARTHSIFPKNYVELNMVRDSYEVAVAEFDFAGQKSGDLAFKEGDEIIVLKHMSEDWWKGRRKDGAEGIFPASYVRLTGELDYATSAEEAAKWEAIVTAAKTQGVELAKKRAEAEMVLAEERSKLEAANADAFQARMKEEHEKAAAARSQKADAEVDATKKKEQERLRVREEQERRMKEAEDAVAKLKVQEEANNQHTSLALEQKKKVKDEDERFSDVAAPPPVTRVKREEKKPPNKFAGLGGGDKCAKCGKGVGMADKAKGPGDTSYHKDCLRCSACDKLLMGGQFTENNNLPYCSVCYSRGFGPKGFGFGGSVASTDGTGVGKDKPSAKGEIEEKSAFSKLGQTAGGKKLW